jgi:PIN domain nuclease of toxin-antitoxin system
LFRFWEATVKHAIGRLALPIDPVICLRTQRERHGILSLPLDEPSVVQLSNLQMVHRDPFDRMLICQAGQHGLRIMSADSHFAGYPVDLFGVT